MKRMKTLVVVDFQRDFCNNKGSLYVEGAEQAEDSIVKHIYTDNEIGEVIFTVDWHTPKHCSFKNNGGMWVPHCVQYSEGAGISQKLINACMDKNLPIKIFKKGNIDNEEEYGAFNKIGLIVDRKQIYVAVNNMAGDSSLKFEYSDVEVCGLAGDYCVKETMSILVNSNKIVNLYAFTDGIASIDGGKIFNEFLDSYPQIKRI